VPAVNTPHPLRWTPGISTGPLKVITVFLFHSSAFTRGENTRPIRARQDTVVVTVLKTLICFISFTLESLRIALRSVGHHAWRPRLVGRTRRNRSIPRTIGTLLREECGCHLVPGPCQVRLERNTRRGAKAENLLKLVLLTERSAHAVIAARNAGIAADANYRVAPRLHPVYRFSLHPEGKTRYGTKL
jgi:hypothetical protein